MKRLLLLWLSIVAILAGCNKNTPEEPQPKQIPISSKVELPQGAKISVKEIKLFENGGEQIEINSNGEFSSNANSLVALGKDNQILYISYLSTDTVPERRNVALNSHETATSLLIQVFPHIFTQVETASFNALKKLVSQLKETKELAQAIDRSIISNGYLNLDDVESEFSNAVEKIIELSGLENNFLRPRGSSNSSLMQFRSTRVNSEITPPIIKNNRFKGVRLDLNKSQFIPKTGKWHCEMTGYNERFGYVALVHGYKGTNGLGYPYSDSFWEQTKFLIPPMNVSKFMGTISSWGGIQAYFSDTWNLFTKKDFGFNDLTWDKSKLSGIYMDFQSPNDIVLVLAPQENDNIFIFNAVMAFVSPAISLLGGEVGDKSSFTKDFTYRFVYKLTTDVKFINEVKAITLNPYLSHSHKVLQISEKLFKKFRDFITGDAIKLFPKLGKYLANQAFKKVISDANFFEKVVKLTGDVVMSYLGLLENSFYFDMQLEFADASEEDGVLKNTVLSDDFNASELDLNKWEKTGYPNSVRVRDGVLEMEQNGVDLGVNLRSKYSFKANDLVKISRRAYIHHANSESYPWMALMFEGGEKFQERLVVYYADYDYENLHGTICIHKKTERLNGRSVRPFYVSENLGACIKDSWFKEEILLSFKEKKLVYKQNDTILKEISLPQLRNQKFYIQFNPYGWWTGHKHYMDDFKLEVK